MAPLTMVGGVSRTRGAHSENHCSRVKNRYQQSLCKSALLYAEPTKIVRLPANSPYPTHVEEVPYLMKKKCKIGSAVVRNVFWEVTIGISEGDQKDRTIHLIMLFYIIFHFFRIPGVGRENPLIPCLGAWNIPSGLIVLHLGGAKPVFSPQRRLVVKKKRNREQPLTAAVVVEW